jgi:hypothetical protein
MPSYMRNAEITDIVDITEKKKKMDEEGIEKKKFFFNFL